MCASTLIEIDSPNISLESAVLFILVNVRLYTIVIMTVTVIMTMTVTLLSTMIMLIGKLGFFTAVSVDVHILISIEVLLLSRSL
jgi:hypothetical protein